MKLIAFSTVCALLALAATAFAVLLAYTRGTDALEILPTARVILVGAVITFCAVVGGIIGTAAALALNAPTKTEEGK